MKHELCDLLLYACTTCMQVREEILQYMLGQWSEREAARFQKISKASYAARHLTYTAKAIESEPY